MLICMLLLQAIRDTLRGRYDLSTQIYKKACGTYVLLTAMTIISLEIIQSWCVAVQCTTVTFALMCSQMSHTRLKFYGLLNHIFCNGKWTVSAYENSCKLCVADFTAVMGIQIHKFKAKKKTLKPLVNLFLMQ